MKNIKIYFQYFIQNKILMTILISGFLLNLAAWIIFWIGLDFDKTALILHYNAFFGIDRIALNSEEKRFFNVFFVAFSGLIIMVINYILGIFLIFSGWKNFNEDDSEKVEPREMSTAFFGGYFLFLAGMILQIVILVYTVAIILVNR